MAKNKKKQRKRGKLWKKIVLSLLLCLSILGGFFAARAQIAMTEVLDSVNRDEENVLADMDLGDIKVHSDNKIINILLIGNDYRKEKLYTASGIPDTVMIATLDSKHKTLKLTSLMRDMVLEIPGHGENRLNSVFGYSDGGVELLYRTIAQNFGIQLDGYVEVGFKAVKKLVNEVGGIEVELTESEANYLNTTNYIRTKKFRNVKEGKNTLNGAQALGYCRIRKTVYTPDGLTDDYGRTWRQRNAINAIFAKVKKMPLSRWLEIAKVVLNGYVRTDLTNDAIISYATDVMGLGTTKIHQLQIPMNNYYENDPDYGSLGDVLIPDIPNNSAALNAFVFDYDGSGEEFEYQPEQPDEETTDPQ